MAFFPNLRVWHMINQDTLEHMSGQFEPENLTEERGSVYSERFTLNRKKAVLQFLHGKTPTVSFTGRFFNETILGPLFAGNIPIGTNTKKNLQTLKDWSERDPLRGRPPIISFWVGAGFLALDCVIETVGGILYDKPAAFGIYKGATFTVNLREFTPFELNAKANFDTRYARVKQGDYYELLAAREYRNPLIGVFLRQENPDKVNLQTGEILRMPAPGGPTIRQAVIEPKSIPFKGAFGSQVTAARSRRNDMVKARNRSRVSHLITTAI